MKKLALSLSLALASVALAAPMLGSSAETKSVSVRSSDLNLDREAGVQSLYSRIQGAAREACKGVESRSASTQAAHKECMRTAVDGAVMSANNDALKSLHLATSGSSSATVAAK
jgi:UrcA family protein